MPNKDSFFLFLIFILLTLNLRSQTKSTFKVVLDAGHGGKDYGAIKNGLNEKDIALDVVLKIGKILEKYEDIELLYSRKKDVFVELRERAEKANKAKANLFVSVHCNSNNSSKPFGALSLVMGMSRKSTNLEIAKTENAVIFLETNYKKKYKGFDPNKPETLIGLKILQEEYLNSSIDFASTVQFKFEKKLNRKNKGVHQQPLWVLDATCMPGVLIELGFLSNKKEANYLGSNQGKNEMANAIASAILQFKENYFSSSDTTNFKDQILLKDNKISQNKSLEDANKKTVYKVLIASSKKKISTASYNFKGLKNISRTYEKGFYKYYFGNENTSAECEKLLVKAKNTGFTSALVVAATNENK